MYRVSFISSRFLNILFLGGFSSFLILHPSGSTRYPLVSSQASTYGLLLLPQRHHKTPEIRVSSKASGSMIGLDRISLDWIDRLINTEWCMSCGIIDWVLFQCVRIMVNRLLSYSFVWVLSTCFMLSKDRWSRGYISASEEAGGGGH